MNSPQFISDIPTSTCNSKPQMWTWCWTRGASGFILWETWTNSSCTCVNFVSEDHWGQTPPLGTMNLWNQINYINVCRYFIKTSRFNHTEAEERKIWSLQQSFKTLSFISWFWGMSWSQVGIQHIQLLVLHLNVWCPPPRFTDRHRAEDILRTSWGKVQGTIVGRDNEPGKYFQCLNHQNQWFSFSGVFEVKSWNKNTRVWCHDFNL